MNKSEKFWDRSAKEYENKKINWEKIYNRAVENTKKHLNSSDVVLDYACGAGVITAQIADYVKEIHAIDISSKMIDVAQRIADERKIENINFSKTTIFDDRYERESFNVITAFNILHLLEDSLEVIQRINKLLKPGGLFISETPCMGEKKSLLGTFLSLLSKLRIVPYLNPLKFSELEDLLKEGNFQIIETEDLQKKQMNYFIVAKKIQL
ncbi:MAG: class I SAM-dependent methyltransferase [Candidatus Heimdallarchaeota archaeon]|nr:class I SAM-dependent methyltransferase [Candidatus Heimdallarchaeota archaeon]MCG3254498.1 class I SAM-dependent methyltransferase [Candidatus Heimdallarchaeota archaeon]MCK4609583.1 class I SAM-dependent methyltransferase [Candidatus Heimdallarchaeota archaeon]